MSKKNYSIECQVWDFWTNDKKEKIYVIIEFECMPNKDGKHSNLKLIEADLKW